MIATDELIDLVRDRAKANEETRCLDAEVVAAISASGLNRSFMPAELGGDETHPREVMDTIARIAAVDGSTGWCSAISAGGNAFSAYVPEKHARRMYVDPDTGSAGVFAAAGVVTREAAGGGTKGSLTGRWPFASNCEHSRWICVGARVQDGHGNFEEQPVLLVLPADDFVVEDTWDGAGLRATGSHHIRADAVPVDLERSFAFNTPPWPGGAMWRMPLFTLLAPVLASAPLGMARGALDEVHRMVREGGGGHLRGKLHDDPVGLAELAAADAALRAAHAGLICAVDEAWAMASGGSRASGAVQARVLMAIQHAGDVSLESTSVAYRLCGGAAAYAGHRVLTALRDVETARQHVLFSHQHRPAIMKIAAGLDGTLPPFVT